MEIQSSDGVFPPVAEEETLEDQMDLSILQDLRNYERRVSARSSLLLSYNNGSRLEQQADLPWSSKRSQMDQPKGG